MQVISPASRRRFMASLIVGLFTPGQARSTSATVKTSGNCWIARRTRSAFVVTRLNSLAERWEDRVSEDNVDLRCVQKLLQPQLEGHQPKQRNRTRHLHEDVDVTGWVSVASRDRTEECDRLHSEIAPELLAAFAQSVENLVARHDREL